MNDLFHPEIADPPMRPAAELWRAQIRWLIAVMNDDDKSLPFVAGCLAYCLKNDGVTDRQAKGLQRVISRVSDDFDNLQLDAFYRDDDMEGDGYAARA